MIVKIRKEQNHYLAYFIDSRRIVAINEIGSMIIDLLFNQVKDIDEIASIIAKECQISLSQARGDIDEFLIQLRNEVYPDGFNVIEQEQLEVPLGVELEITTSCNLSCKHCFQSNHDSIHMPLDKVIYIIKKLADHQVCEVTLIGGEPFRHPDLISIIEYCRYRDMAVNLVTNATLMDDGIIERLCNIKRLAVIVSLDGNEVVHNYIRGDGVFNKVDRILKQLRSHGIATEITCTLNSINISLYREVIEYCENIGIPCNFNLFKPFRPEHGQLILDPNVFFEAVIDLFKLRRDKGYRIGISNAAIVSQLLNLPLRNECRATRSGTVIDVNGRMVTCPSLVAAGYYKENELPFFDDDFVEKWRNHHAFVSFRNNGLRECQARSFIFSGNVKGYDPYGISAFLKYLQSNIY